MIFALVVLAIFTFCSLLLWCMCRVSDEGVLPTPRVEDDVGAALKRLEDDLEEEA